MSAQDEGLASWPRQYSETPLQRACRLGATIERVGDEIESTQRFPCELLVALHASGLLRLLLPESVGGEEVRPSTYFQAVEALGRHDGSVAWNVFVANSSALIAPFLPMETAHTIFANTDTVVSWGPPNACRAYAEAGGYRLSGEWPFASGCRQANWMGAHCHVVESDGSLRVDSEGRTVLRTLLFPAAEATLRGDWNPIGLRGTASESYAVHDLFIHEAYSSTRDEPEARREPGPLYAFTMQGLYAVGVAGVALGLARAMLDEFNELAQSKTPRGLDRLADMATVQDEVARAEAKHRSARAWLLQTLDEIYDACDGVRSINVESRALVRLASAHGIQTAIEVGDMTYRLAGVSAIFPGSPFERRFRDLHTVSQQIQSRPSHFRSVGRVLLGTPPAVFF